MKKVATEIENAANTAAATATPTAKAGGPPLPRPALTLQPSERATMC